MKRFDTTLLLIAALLSSSTAMANANEMTCRGPLYGSNGIYNIGRCYIHNNAPAHAAVDAACKTEQPCIISASVVRRGTPNRMPQSYTVVKVHSAKRELDKCSGVLTQLTDGEPVLMFPPEGTCTFSADDARKITAICAKGQWCEVTGIINPCQDAGECVEVSSIVSIKRLRRR